MYIKAYKKKFHYTPTIYTYIFHKYQAYLIKMKSKDITQTALREHALDQLWPDILAEDAWVPSFGLISK